MECQQAYFAEASDLGVEGVLIHPKEVTQSEQTTG